MLPCILPSERYFATNFISFLQLYVLDIYFKSPVDISLELLNIHYEAMEIGQIDIAMMSLHHSFRCRLLGGYNLSLLLQSHEDELKLSVS